MSRRRWVQRLCALGAASAGLTMAAQAWPATARVCAGDATLFVADQTGMLMPLAGDTVGQPGGAAAAVTSYRFSTVAPHVYLAVREPARGRGVLADFEFEGVQLVSGERAWTVTSAPAPKGPPTAADVRSAVETADSKQAWSPISQRGYNFGFRSPAEVPQIAEAARWMWADAEAEGRMLVFRLSLVELRPEFQLERAAVEGLSGAGFVNRGPGVDRGYSPGGGGGGLDDRGGAFNNPFEPFVRNDGDGTPVFAEDPENPRTPDRPAVSPGEPPAGRNLPPVSREWPPGPPPDFPPRNPPPSYDGPGPTVPEPGAAALLLALALMARRR
ncbi:MAG: hypothetical protein HRU75_03085 [Planctomycetia bacterium]|nr:MAG: hypothetical protein HRU75_03085 [Planctomycetia bacterium]